MQHFDVIVVDDDPATTRPDPASHAAANAIAHAGLSVALVQTGTPAPAPPGVTLLAGQGVWSVTRETPTTFRIDMLGAPPATAPRLVACLPVQDRMMPFPGWTLPWVTPLAAATPGPNLVLAGCGIDLARTAARLLHEGARLAAVIDLSSPAEWAAALPDLARHPGRLATAARDLARLGPRIHFRHTILAAEDTPAGRQIRIAPVDAAGRPNPARARTLACDTLAIGQGHTVRSDIPRLLRAAHRFDPLGGGWLPEQDRAGRTTIPGLYVATANDPGAGHRAGTAAASDAAAKSPPKIHPVPPMRHTAIARLARRRPGLLHAITPDTIVCPCESLTRTDLDAAIAAGATEVNQLKHFTRCGMGACQGRLCAEAAAELVAHQVGSRAAAGSWTIRPPLRPLPMQDLVGDFTYADIPVPPAAPL